MALPHITLVGCGRMGRAMLAGWLANGIPPGRISVVEHSRENAAAIAREFGVDAHETPTNGDAEGTIVFAVKPQALPDVLPLYKPLLKPDTLIISVAAGKTLAFYTEALGGQPRPIVRVMPNLPCLISKGVSGLVANAEVSATQHMQAERLFSVLGKTVWLEHEEGMHALTAISGSGPAYVFYFMQAMIAAAIKAGLTREQAELLVRPTLEGSVLLANSSKDSPEQLRANVTSPGGTTAAAMEVFLKDEAFQSLISGAIEAAIARSREMG